MTFTSESNFANALNIIDANTHLRIDEGPSTAGWPAPNPLHPNPTNQIVQTDQAIHCHFTWQAKGFLHQMFAAPPGSGHTADWFCTVYAERIGTGSGPTLPVTPIPFAGGFAHTYNKQVTIPANTLAVGVYRIVCTITCKHHYGFVLPVAAFNEGMYLQVYKA